MRLWRRIPVAVLIAALLPIQAAAGTTGGFTGRVVDATTKAPLAGVTVTAVAPSQSATTVTDAAGAYQFLSLAPDTYTVSFAKSGYDPVTQPGLSIFADQVQTVNVTMSKALQTIAKVTATSASSLVRAGNTSDVYSVNAAGQQAAKGLTGPGSLNNAYGAIASVPGVMIDPGEVGWWQTVHIRGGDIDQVGYELDGIPVNRAYDNAPQTMLSSLGSQEVQVYTGGVPASSDAQGISGYVNQVIKSGTYPGYATASLGVGYPAFYHQASVEAGGATPDRLFSYYVGIGGADQSFNYINNQNGANIPNSFFYPVNALPGANGYVYTGPNSPGLFTSGLAFSLTTQSLRDDIMDFHFGIPHKNSSLRDDVQALWMTSENDNDFFSSTNDIGPALLENGLGGPPTWDDSYLYQGPVMQPFVPSDLKAYYYPNSPPHAFGGDLPDTLRDNNINSVSVTKLQYQHVFSPASYLRVYGYSLYSGWFINGPNSDAEPYYGWELPYVLPDHTYGFNVSYENQLSAENLFSVTGAFTASNLSRWDVTYFPSDWGITNYVATNGSGDCYSRTTGNQIGCYAQTQGTTPNPVIPIGYSCSTKPAPAACAPGVDPAELVTNTSFNGYLNQVGTHFSGYSIGDQWRPNDKLNVNLGLRLEDFEYLLGSTDPDDPARAFWFKAYNAEYCYGDGINDNQPVLRGQNGLGACPTGTSAVHLYDTSGGNYTAARFQPRLGLTYDLDSESVLRGSFGIYARPPNSSWTQYNVLQEDLPSFLGKAFYGYGFDSPNHEIRPDTSYNYDLSWEHRLKGTDWSFKLSPFFRATRDQLQNFYINPQGGLESGLNVGNQQTSGVEFALQKGDFSRDGLSGQLSFTYTHSQIRYQDFTGTNQNVIDQLNTYISQYDSYVRAAKNDPNGFPCFTYYNAANGSGGTGTSCNGPNVVHNPYWGLTYQPLLSPTAWYTTYDVIPGPAAAANGYATPYVTALILNYKHRRFTVTNSWNFNSGASYGSPTQWPGYLPNSCAAPSAAWIAGNGKAADPASCNDLGQFPLFIPDKFTGKFDTLGALKQPWQLQMGLALSYEVSPRVTANLNFSNLLDVCGQRGYAWDNPYVCAYSSLPTNFLYPAGNFYPNSTAAAPPPQLQYPYSFWFNGNNTGFEGVVMPLQITGSIQIKL